MYTGSCHCGAVRFRVDVTINDRGPYIKGRIIDVTIGTAEKLGFVKNGVVPVKVEVLDKADAS